MNVLLVSQGDYSDYNVITVVDWVSDKTPEQARDVYLDQYPRQRGDYKFKPYAFVGWLTRNGYANEIECEELLIQTYGRVDTEWKRQKRVMDPDGHHAWNEEE